MSENKNLAAADELAYAAFEARHALFQHLKTHPRDFNQTSWVATPEALRAGFRVLAIMVVRALKKQQEREKAGGAVESPPMVPPPLGSPWKHEQYGVATVIADSEGFVRLAGPEDSTGTRVVYDVPLPVEKAGWAPATAEPIEVHTNGAVEAKS